MLRVVRAARYVLPFREGGSVPALVEGDDLGMYVVKLRGAGQGVKALLAELVSGELARTLGLAVPEIVLTALRAIPRGAHSSRRRRHTRASARGRTRSSDDCSRRWSGRAPAVSPAGARPRPSAHR
jgi:hypothetical protein